MDEFLHAPPPDTVPPPTRTLRQRWAEFWPNVVPILLAVGAALFIRAFIVQAYEIPSGSMIPTLLIGDQLIVNKLGFGVKLPFSTRQIAHYGSPKRGDIVVFQYPIQPDIDFIKRVIGLPGDRIAWKDNQLIVNGQAVPRYPAGTYTYRTEDGKRDADRFIEVYGGRSYTVLYSQSPIHTDSFVPEFEVPEEHYYMIGDNRDNSNDSRRWGFVHESLLRGPAVVIHFSWDSVEKRLRFDRLGRLVN